jgi:hypothetical protein
MWNMYWFTAAMLSCSYTGWLFPTIAVAQRFAVMDTAPALSPRYYQAASPLRPLGKRQLAPCEAGEHTCESTADLSIITSQFGDRN